MSEDPKPVGNEGAPAPETLTAQTDSVSEVSLNTETSGTVQHAATPLAHRRIAYRPSHKATFIGLGVIGLILAVNAIIITLVLRGQTSSQDAAVKNGVTLSNTTLNQLGVSRNPIGNAETELIVGPNSKFNGKVQIGSDLTVAGQLILNSTLKASDASLTNLQAGDTQLQSLNVNGDGTVTNLNLRKDLQVAGATRLQGSLTVDQLTTINNDMNIAGNLAIGGTLSVRNFQVANLTLAGHLISSGSAPAVVAGGAVGNNGTVSISGNDTSGTISVNTGTGAGNGLLASVTFATKYDSTPHIVISPIGHAVPGLYINRTSAGFTVSVEGAMNPAGYAFDYIIAQ